MDVSIQARYGMIIDGEEVWHDGRHVESVDPATGDVITHVARGTAADVEKLSEPPSMPKSAGGVVRLPVSVAHCYLG